MRSTWFPRTLLTMFFVIAAIEGVRPMVSYRALAIGATPFQLGVIAAAYALLSLFLALPVGRWVDRAGETRFIVIGAVTVVAVSVFVSTTDTVPGLVVAHALLGIGQLLTVVGIQSLLAVGDDDVVRDGRFGLLAAVVSVGQIAGPALGGLVADRLGAGTTGAFLVSAALAGVGVTVAASVWRWSPPHAEGVADADADRVGVARSVRRLLGLPGMAHGLLASLTVLASVDILIAYLPAYGERHGLSVSTVGLLLAARAATSTVARVGMVAMIRGLGRRRLLTSSMAVTACALALLPLAGDRVPVLFVLLGLSGVGLGLAQPMTMSWVAGRAPAAERATALSVRITGNRLGQLLLPVAVGGVAGAAGVPAIFLALGVVLAGSAAAVVRTSFGQEPDD